MLKAAQKTFNPHLGYIKVMYPEFMSTGPEIPHPVEISDPTWEGHIFRVVGDSMVKIKFDAPSDTTNDTSNDASEMEAPDPR